MNLSFRKIGTGEPLIILHGLFGSSDNWYTIGKALSEHFEVYLIDQRNHGNSPHDAVHTYQALADDLNDFMILHHLEASFILGHSMGGKAAIAFGLKYPQQVKKMIVVDISPFAYEGKSLSGAFSHKHILEALKTLALTGIKDRATADEHLGYAIHSPAIRQFLLKNLKRTENGFKWSLNIEALDKNLEEIYAAVLDEKQLANIELPVFPLLFIRGAKSDYIRNNDAETIRHYFPWAVIRVVENAGHWVHADQPDRLLAIATSFLIDPKELA